MSKLFGVPLAKLYENGGFPSALISLIEFIEIQGLETPGLFDLSISDRDVLSFKGKLDRGEEGRYSVKVAAALLKLFLFELPEPLYTFPLYSVFLRVLQTVTVADSRIFYFKILLDSLPLGNRIFIYRLLDLLFNLVKFKSSNHLSLQFLASELSGAFLRGGEGEREDVAAATAVVSQMIEYAETMISEAESDIIELGISSFNYQKKSESELSFKIGDLVFIVKEDETGWWEGEINGEYGFFPVNYFKVFYDFRTSTHLNSLAAILSAQNSKENSSEKSSSSSSANRGGGGRGGRGGGEGRGGGREGGSGGMSRKEFLKELEELKKQTATESKEREKLTRQIQSLTSQIGNTKEIFQSKHNLLSSSSPIGSSSSNNLLFDYQNLKSEFEVLKVEISELSKFNSSLEENYSSLYHSYLSSKSVASDLRSDNQSLRSDLKNLNALYDSLKSVATSSSDPSPLTSSSSPSPSSSSLSRPPLKPAASSPSLPSPSLSSSSPSPSPSPSPSSSLPRPSSPAFVRTPSAPRSLPSPSSLSSPSLSSSSPSPSLPSSSLSSSSSTPPARAPFSKPKPPGGPPRLISKPDLSH